MNLFKKKYQFLLSIVIGGFLLFTNVYAEESSISELPKEYNSSEFTYTIEGFEIRIYDGSNDKEGNSKYFSKKEVLYTIPVTDTTLTINPQELISSMSRVNGTFIDLNLSIDKEKFESLVKSKVSSLNNDDCYICELIVKYKLSKVPTGYKFMNHINTLDFIWSIFTGGSSGIEGVNLNTSTYQILNIGSLTTENGVLKFSLDEEASKDESGVTESVAVLDYVYFSQTEEIELTNNSDSTQSYIFMFHNLDHIEKLLQSYNQIYQDTSNQLEDLADHGKNQNQTVKVADTAFDVSKILLGIGCLIMVMGITIITLSIKKGKSKIQR